jgi:hypothetical protein
MHCGRHLGENKGDLQIFALAAPSPAVRQVQASPNDIILVRNPILKNIQKALEKFFLVICLEQPSEHLSLLHTRGAISL